jgi:hypothetical protein
MGSFSRTSAHLHVSIENMLKAIEESIHVTISRRSSDELCKKISLFKVILHRIHSVLLYRIGEPAKGPLRLSGAGAATCRFASLKPVPDVSMPPAGTYGCIFNFISLLTTNRKPIIITTKPIYLVWINLFGRLGFTDLPGSLKNPAKCEEYAVCLR